MRLELPSKPKLVFALLGSGHHLCTFAEMLVENGFPRPVIITHPREQHGRDKLLLQRENLYKNVFDTAESLDLPILDAPTVNAPEVLTFLQTHGATAAFSLSCRSIIRKELIDFVDGRIFNIHPSMLPAERGGGTFSWRILNDNKEVSGTLHLLDEGIDTGGVIAQRRAKLNLTRPLPRDYIAATNELYTDLLRQFLDQCETGTVEARDQDEAGSSYLPRLYTELNGAIDWRWRDADIDRFIRAFGAPYTGAFSFVDDTRIAITEADLIPLATRNHPFLKGRIIGFDAEGCAKVLLEEHLLLVRTISVDGKKAAPRDMLGLNKIFHTPKDVLTTARLTVPKVAQMCDVPGGSEGRDD